MVPESGFLIIFLVIYFCVVSPYHRITKNCRFFLSVSSLTTPCFEQCGYHLKPFDLNWSWYIRECHIYQRIYTYICAISYAPFDLNELIHKWVPRHCSHWHPPLLVQHWRHLDLTPRGATLPLSWKLPSVHLSNASLTSISGLITRIWRLLLSRDFVSLPLLWEASATLALPPLPHNKCFPRP